MIKKENASQMSPICHNDSFVLPRDSLFFKGVFAPVEMKSHRNSRYFSFEEKNPLSRFKALEVISVRVRKSFTEKLASILKG